MTAIEILDKYGINKTSLRLKVIESLLNNKCLSCAEIIRYVKISKSRASVLRILTDLKSRGLVHNTINKELNQKFFFNEASQRHHTYFTCIKCDRLFVFKLPEKIVTVIPVNLQVENIAYNVTGICADCSNAKQGR